MATKSNGSSVDPPRQTKEDTHPSEDKLHQKSMDAYLELNFAANQVNTTNQKISNGEEKIPVYFDTEGMDGEKDKTTTSQKALNQEHSDRLNSTGYTDVNTTNQKITNGEEKIPMYFDAEGMAGEKDKTTSQKASKQEHSDGSNTPGYTNANPEDRKYSNGEKIRLWEVNAESKTNDHEPSSGQQSTKEFPSQNSQTDGNWSNPARVSDSSSRNITYNFGTVNASTFTGYVEK